MRKVLMVFLVVGLAFIACGDGNTERTRCNSDALNSQSMLDPELCGLMLGFFYGKPQFRNEFDVFLIQCLNYNLELYKCEKKSNILPP